ncbi:MAG: Re/Si-specific NAD(P)(+) transhydrogenase subunit alpha [Bacteroidales bacterium]
MKIGLLKESAPEQRVALLPEAAGTLTSAGHLLLVESGAGEAAFAGDEDYRQAGCTIVSRKEVIDQAELLVMIHPPHEYETGTLGPEKILLGMFSPLVNKSFVRKIAESGVTAFSLDMVPRITRAQAMDVLSSQATVAGYRAVLEAAYRLPRFFPMFMTAAGTIKPAKVLVLGAGVAGLQAIATARKLGAVVEAFDVRSAVKEEVQSLGAKFVEVEGAREDASAGGYAVEQTEEFRKKQLQLIQEHAVKSDVVICTAQIPGRRAPLLVLKETVESMLPGSVIIDLAASTGGNCELTEDQKIVLRHQVTIIGNSVYPAGMPVDASRMFGKNMLNFLKLLTGDENVLSLNFDDEVVKGACLTHQGEVINERIKSALEAD